MVTFIEKGFLYGFILGLSLGFFIVPYKEVSPMGEGVTETTYLNLVDFIIPLMRVGVITAVIGGLVGFFFYRKKIRACNNK
ncbi:hypothetical protein [Priestia megaterium]|uniref:hypothetical protein n=1 Tax=Priestia megaterium TaxID=1404 RepID=UPI000BEC4C1B|nr:hypothetical protein [Priestia megaterium]MDP9580314.1 uncharacterized protein YneF (UPF0154 family) [Bacillus sp. 1751]MED4067597.1 hypothetical protein [Priestia megaterium]PED63409.1 hypothetical protein CON20_27115 [Priestia megaterium]